jgi:hypothetical protein
MLYELVNVSNGFPDNIHLVISTKIIILRRPGPIKIEIHVFLTAILVGILATLAAILDVYIYTNASVN